MKTFLAYIQLARPLNGIIAFISTWLGGIFASGNVLKTFSDLKMYYVSVATVLLLTAGNALNDYCDYNIDKINKPNRPLPSGRIAPRNALIFSIVLISIGIGLGVLINIYAVLVAVLVSSLLISYAVLFKRIPIAGNLIVGSLTSLTFISGGIAIGSMQNIIIPAIFAFLFTTAREIVKDLEDIDGDQKNNVKTIAILKPKLAVFLTLTLMASIVIFSPIPYLIGWYTWHYLVVIVFGVDLVLIGLAIRLVQVKSKANYTFIQQWMKWDIFMGLCAICIGVFVNG